jgi:lysozyme family protein
MPTFEETELGYRNMWDTCGLVQATQSQVEAVCDTIYDNRDIYREVQLLTGDKYQTAGVPWVMIGALHNRESSCDFDCHLHNGDPLTARTTHVPAGQPESGSPPFTWEESAVDALTMPPHELGKIVNWNIERILYECERYNGWGYYGKCNSPYLWSMTNHYTGGKYVADGQYDPNAWDKQVGCAAIFKVLNPVKEGMDQPGD